MPGLETPAAAANRLADDPLPLDHSVVREVLVVVDALSEIQLEEPCQAILAAQGLEGHQLHPGPFGVDQQHRSHRPEAVVLLPELAPFGLNRKLGNPGDAPSQISEHLVIRA